MPHLALRQGALRVSRAEREPLPLGCFRLSLVELARPLSQLEEALMLLAVETSPQLRLAQPVQRQSEGRDRPAAQLRSLRPIHQLLNQLALG